MLAVFALGLAFWALLRGPAEPPSPQEPGAQATQALPAATPPSQRSKAFEPGPAPAPRLALPRPEVRAQVPAPRVLAEVAPSAEGPLDRRGDAGPNARRQLEIIRYAFETLDDDISECLAQWEALQPGQAAEVMLAFEIDADGLQRSWLEHDAGLPLGPQSCLANAVYGLDWSHIVEAPAMITNRFTLGARDAGSQALGIKP